MEKVFGFAFIWGVGRRLLKKVYFKYRGGFEVYQSDLSELADRL